jgi:hypothetical protein
MSTMNSAVTRVTATAPQRWTGVRRIRAVAGLMVLVTLGLVLGASLLFAKPYLPARPIGSGSVVNPGGHGTPATESSTPADPHC